MSDVSALWDSDVDIMDFSDTDLEAKRTKFTMVSDSSRELHAMADILADHWGLDRSGTLDRVLRIELARLIENGDVSFAHEDYDLAYTIPPVEWVADGEIAVLDAPEIDTDEYTDWDRQVGFSTSPVVYEMAQQAIAEGAYDHLTAMVIAGVKRCLGYKT